MAKKTVGGAVPAWLKLDNAAKIYPPARSHGWAPMFRLSVTLAEPVDPEALARAHRTVLRRFPTFGYRLRRGLFWYYLERMNGQPELQQDVGNPLVRMDLRENGRFMYRIRYHGRRIAVEFFHALTDGTGGLSFLLTLAAEYLHVKKGLHIPCTDRILNCREAPRGEEIEDSFLKHARGQGKSRFEKPAYTISGTPERRYFLNITTGIMPAKAVIEKAKSLGVSVSAFLTSVLIGCFQEMQQKDPVRRKRRMPVKVSLPINLRRFYGSTTLRNFSSYLNVGIDSAYGRYTFEEILNLVKHTLGLEISEKGLNARMSANVNSEKNFAVRAMPLFVKSPFMKAMFMLQGDRYCSTTFSNLGEVVLPEEMRPHVTRMDFLLGVPYRNPVVAACVSYGGNMYISFSRVIREPYIERAFFTTLIKMGIPVRVESNQR
ncbi:MAG: hypothetical protein GX647_01285 [Clostridiales bacterium]|jgi:NRPS condensation-like uncharacterized protein|nr:hypothetical protein [Clostridiales bacterium]